MHASLLIKNGNIYNVVRSCFEKQDIALINNKIVLVNNLHAYTYDILVDASDLYISPGFIDHHCHVFYSGTDLGFKPDLCSFAMGCTTLVDAGSAGVSNFQAFYNSGISNSRTRVLTYLNVASVGQINEYSPEFADPKYFERERIEDLLGSFPQIRGLKLRFDKACVKDLGLNALISAKDLANDLKVPLVVHVSNHPDSITNIVDILDKGDVLCHTYQNLCEGILDDSHKVKKEILKAREKGVLFDSADGFRNNSFFVLQKAFSQGFIPDIISTDLTKDKAYTNRGFGIIYAMSKYLALGMSLEEVIKAVTFNPAQCMKVPDLGIIQENAQADLCIFIIEDAMGFNFRDYKNIEVKAKGLIRPLMTISQGDIVYSDFTMIRDGRILK